MIYRNCLGMLESAASISISGGLPLKNGGKTDRYYCLSTTIKGYPSKRWNIDTPIEDIVREMNADGFACKVSKDGFGNERIACTHTETQTVMDALKDEQDQRFSGATRGYVRFGELPEGGRSRNYRDDILENGVSCFDAEFSDGGEYRLLLTPVLEVSYLTVYDRQAYRLYGDVVGTGADGEPLLRVDRLEKI